MGLQLGTVVLAVAEAFGVLAAQDAVISSADLEHSPPLKARSYPKLVRRRPEGGRGEERAA